MAYKDLMCNRSSSLELEFYARVMLGFERHLERRYNISDKLIKEIFLFGDSDELLEEEYSK